MELEDTNFDIGSAGADQSSDLTGSISNKQKFAE